MGPYEATGEPLTTREETTTTQWTTLREETKTKTIEEVEERLALVLSPKAILIVVAAIVALIGVYLYRCRSEISKMKLVEKKYCIECGKPIPLKAEYCPYCGAKSQE
jgi:ribosomal protein S24E